MTADIALLLILVLLSGVGFAAARWLPQPTTCPHAHDQATCFQCWADNQL